MHDETARRLEAALADDSHEFGNFFITRMLGLDISYPGETCLIRFPVEPLLHNPQGSYHGGMLATVMDVAMGHLIRHATGAAGLTLEMKTQFMRPLTIGPATCEGRFLRRGRSVGFMEARVSDGGERLIAHATATWKLAGVRTDDRP